MTIPNIFNHQHVFLLALLALLFVSCSNKEEQEGKVTVADYASALSSEAHDTLVAAKRYGCNVAVVTYTEIHFNQMDSVAMAARDSIAMTDSTFADKGILVIGSLSPHFVYVTYGNDSKNLISSKNGYLSSDYFTTQIADSLTLQKKVLKATGMAINSYCNFREGYIQWLINEVLDLFYDYCLPSSSGFYNNVAKLMQTPVRYLHRYVPIWIPFFILAILFWLISALLCDSVEESAKKICLRLKIYRWLSEGEHYTINDLLLKGVEYVCSSAVPLFVFIFPLVSMCISIIITESTLGVEAFADDIVFGGYTIDEICKFAQNNFCDYSFFWSLVLFVFVVHSRMLPSLSSASFPYMLIMLVGALVVFVLPKGICISFTIMLIPDALSGIYHFREEADKEYASATADHSETTQRLLNYMFVIVIILPLAYFWTDHKVTSISIPTNMVQLSIPADQKKYSIIEDIRKWKANGCKPPVIYDGAFGMQVKQSVEVKDTTKILRITTGLMNTDSVHIAVLVYRDSVTMHTSYARYIAFCNLSEIGADTYISMHISDSIIGVFPGVMVPQYSDSVEWDGITIKNNMNHSILVSNGNLYSIVPPKLTDKIVGTINGVRDSITQASSKYYTITEDGYSAINPDFKCIEATLTIKICILCCFILCLFMYILFRVIECDWSNPIAFWKIEIGGFGGFINELICTILIGCIVSALVSFVIFIKDWFFN